MDGVHPATSVARSSAQAIDAVALLKGDHRQIKNWFIEFQKASSGFQKASSGPRRLELVRKICQTLRVHTIIEEEIFYPAFLAASEDKDLHHEAIIEHEGAKRLIAEIETLSPADEYYDARVTVLDEMIKHHVKEEEQPGGMFAEARKCGLDLKVLGARMQARKLELKLGTSGQAQHLAHAAEKIRIRRLHPPRRPERPCCRRSQST